MPIATTVVGNNRVAARVVLATCNMSTERGSPTSLDGTHHLYLGKAHMAAIGLTPSGAVIAEDVGDLQIRTGRRRRRLTSGLLGLFGLGASAPGSILDVVRHVEAIEHALDRGDQPGRDPRVACRRLQLLVTEQCLDRPARASVRP